MTGLQLPLAAGIDAVRNMGHRFQADEAQLGQRDLFTLLGIVAAVVVTILVLKRLTPRDEQRRASNSPRALFRELCRVHNLDRQSRGLLKRLAAFRGLASPAELFLHPEMFWTDAEGVTEDLARLADRLFGEEKSAPLPPKPVAPVSTPIEAPASKPVEPVPVPSAPAPAVVPKDQAIEAAVALIAASAPGNSDSNMVGHWDSVTL